MNNSAYCPECKEVVRVVGVRCATYGHSIPAQTPEIVAMPNDAEVSDHITHREGPVGPIVQIRDVNENVIAEQG